MKRLFFLIVFIPLLYTTGRAQNPNLDFNGSVKFSNQVSVLSQHAYNRDTTLYDLQYRNGSYELFQPTFAVQWKNKRNNFHEIGLGDFSFASGMVLTASLRYDYIVNLYKAKDWKVVPSLGFGANPYFVQTIDNPEVSYEFRTSNTYVGLKFLITPGMTYFFSKKVFLDVNIPFCVFDMYYESYTEEDPTLTLDERKTTSVEFGSVFPEYFSVRFGIGITF